MDRYITSEELAKRLDVSHATIVSWRQRGYGPKHYKIGGRVRYAIEEVERYEADIRNRTE